MYVWVSSVCVCVGVCVSLVPRPPPRIYLAAVEKKQFLPIFSTAASWAEAWERGCVYVLIISSAETTLVLFVLVQYVLASFPVPR